MPVNVSINFQVDSADEARSKVDDMDLPDGAMVNITSTEVIAYGVVKGGKIAAPEALSEEEPTSG